MRVICISDPHGRHREIDLPYGDLLVCAGDITMCGELAIVEDFANWLIEQQSKGRFGLAIVVAGNHDWCFDPMPSHPSWAPPYDSKAEEMIKQAAVYLNDSGMECMGAKVWGSPIQPWFHDWAFNRQRGQEIREHWQLIPPDTDILITHGPPLGFGDRPYNKYDSVGCADLALKVSELQPKLHVFGHIHGGYGVTVFNGTTLVNASVVNEAYKYANSPIVIEL
jgi:predicted phosphodiesterase